MPKPFSRRDLLERVLPLLREYAAEKTQAQAAKALGWSKQLASHWSIRLEESGHIRKRGKFAGYEILQPGLFLLSATPEEMPRRIRLDKFGLKFPQVAPEKRPIPWVRVPRIRNWELYVVSRKYLAYLGAEMKIEKHVTGDGTWIVVYAGPVEGDSETKLKVEAWNHCVAIARRLEDKSGMRLAVEHAVAIRANGLEYVPEDVRDPVVSEMARRHGTMRGPGWKIDMSKGEPEIEFGDAKDVNDYIRVHRELPALTAALLARVDLLRDTTEKGTQDIVTALGKVGEVMEKTGEGFTAVRRLLEKLLPESEGAGSESSQKSKPPDPRTFS